MAAIGTGLERLISWINIFLILCISAGQFALLVMPSGWHRRMSYFYTFDIGLWRVNVSHGVVGNIAIFVAEAAGLKKEWKETLQKLIQGDCTLGDMTRRMCQLPHFGVDFCSVWEKLRVGSLVILFVNSTAIFLHLLGAGFIYYYWFKKAMPVTRMWMWALTSVPAFLYSIALAQYALLSMDLAMFPPQTESMTYSTCSMICALLTGFSWVPMVLMMGCGKKAKEETLMKARKELKEAEKDAAVMCGMGVELAGGSNVGGPSARGADPYASAPHSGYSGQLPVSGCGGQPPSSGYPAVPGSLPLMSGQQQTAYGVPPASGGVQPPSWGVQPPSWGATSWRAGVDLSPSNQTTGPDPGFTQQYTMSSQQATCSQPPWGYGQQSAMHQLSPSSAVLSRQGFLSSSQGLPPSALSSNGVVSACQELEKALYSQGVVSNSMPLASANGAQAAISSTQGLSNAYNSNYATLG